ncbi:hypothetical protein HNQ76_002267 [Thermosulfuriphilus ammonigenes]|nr:hypothetical protein [Thermosulfuriphilus ammonigenes]
MVIVFEFFEGKILASVLGRRVLAEVRYVT